MTAALWWQVIKVIAMVLPTIVSAVREGRIKGDAQDEVLAELLSQHSRKVWEAKEAQRKAENDKKEWQRD